MEEGPDVGGPLRPITQSERRMFYAAALEKLRAGNFIYPCTCSRKDIRDAASARHTRTTMMKPHLSRNVPAQK